MAVLLQTSQGDVVIDLHAELAPKACKNFLKLCKLKYYNNCIFFNVQKDFIIQAGDPTSTGKGGDSLNKLLYGEQARFFEDEITPRLKHRRLGTVGCASAGPDMNNSQFYITAREEVSQLDEKHTIFGQVSEGLDVVTRIADAYCDDTGRPWVNLRIHHTIVLDDPFPDPPGLDALIPEGSPEFVKVEDDGRLEDDWQPGGEARNPEEVEQELRRKEAKSRAVVLEMIGDLPEADAKPPDNQLFVCKLNPVTSDEDLEIIFSRFGRITQCDIIRDYKTGDSLCYAFITFEEPTSAEAAYFKMDNALIDDRRVHVDFSQSMHDLWRQFKRHGKGGGRAENAQYADEDRQGGGRGGGGRGTGGRGGRGGGRGERQLEYKSGLGPVVLAGGGGGYSGEGRGGGERQPPRAPGERRDGDWPCPRCGNNCYAFRTECNRCQTPKGAVVEAAPQRAAPPPPQQQQYRPAPPPPPPRHADDGGRERDERERRRSRSREPRERRRSRSRERERRRSRSRSGERKKKHHSRKHSRSRSRDRSRR